VLELRLAAAVKWYELGLVSQSKAAEIAGLSCSDFIAELSRYKVSPFQYDADEIISEVDVEWNDGTLMPPRSFVWQKPDMRIYC